MSQRMIEIGNILGRKWVGERRALYSATNRHVIIQSEIRLNRIVS
jgi:hypothetical protein